MFIIDIKEIIEYCNCPYSFKFSKENTTEYQSIERKYNQDIHQAIYSYNELLLGGENPGLRQLNKVFMTLWIGGNKSKEEILFTEPKSWRDSVDQKRKRGLNCLFSLHKFLTNQKYIPTFINFKYKIPISKSIILTGDLELARKIGDLHELIIFKTNDGVSNKYSTGKDLKITSDFYAFRALTGNFPEILTLYDLDKDKYIAIKRKKDNINEFFKIIKTVSVCIQNNVYYPNPGAQCSKCIYNSKCLQ